MSAGRTDAVDRFAIGYPPLLAVVAGLSDATIRWRPGPSSWSIHQVLVHLADSEVQFHLRLRSILADEPCNLPAYDERAWAIEARYEDVDRSEAIALIRLLRSINTAFLRRLPASSWTRTGIHSLRGDLSIARLVDDAITHVEQHMAQIRRILVDHAERQAT